MSAFDTAVRSIQFLSADAVEKATCGHPGTPMALAGITTDLFSRYLRYNPADPEWPNRDRFVLSCGHASMLLYSVLHLAGYDLPKAELENFRQWGSKTPGHPEYGHTVGVETTTGPLGQGISNAVGLALASKASGARFNTADTKIFDYRVFALASDGDLMEGVSSEASSLAAQWALDNLIVIYDDNNITIDGKAEISFREDVAKRYEAYGWGVRRCDGHDPESVRAAVDAALADTSRPSLIIAKTHIGIGCPTKQDTSAAHGSALGAEEIAGAKRAADWPVEPPFLVPDEAYEPFKARVAAVKTEYDQWQKTVGGLKGEVKASLDAFLARQPVDLLASLAGQASDKKEATRASGGTMLQNAAKEYPFFLSGAADLAGSTKTDLKGEAFIDAREYAGRNLHYGVREHGMGAIANGLALSGFTPVVSTFLIFSDYMRPSIRLAAMMQQRVAYVFTHDSFYVGEDGPTHQPIEQTASLRLVPGLDVVRPADSMECAMAWAHVLERQGPTALLLTRQGLPPVERPAGFDPKQMMKGAYVATDVDDPTLVIMASGSEVSLAQAAAKLLTGQRVRVVSVPCVELFERQSQETHRAILGTARRVSIEAGVTGTWYKWLGSDGIAIGIDHFGASAPAERLAEEFGLTPQQVAKKISDALA
jgi:transketolase